MSNKESLFKNDEEKEVFWHTSSHILAQAIKRIYPVAKLVIGPAIENGFYYDIDLETKIVEEDFKKIEKEAKKIIDSAYEIKRDVLSKKEAIELFKSRNEDYKIDLINKFDENEEISIYTQGEFIDLCKGPHLKKTNEVKAFKILSVSGSYLGGDSKNKMLQRVYGISFKSKDELNEYITFIKEAKKRDHRLIGKEMGLFEFFDEAPGFPFFLPAGMVLRNELEKYWREEHKKHGYQEIKTPLILSEELWHRSGHYDHYKENMYFTKIDDRDFAVKPMNCPGSMLVYKKFLHSYKNFPLRYAELGQVHRHELSGALHGLFRVRTFTQDDAHIFILESQIKDEIKRIIAFIDSVYKVFDFSYHIELSTRPDDFLGEKETWDNAENILKDVIKDLKTDYIINEGDGAFYGPKLDFHIKDSLGRTWQCATIQLDFQMPEKFDLNYVDETGSKENRPVMIHRVIFGSVERFIGILIEHFKGKFPLWLQPVQAKVLSVNTGVNDYANEILRKLEGANIRAEIDERNEKIGYKIREARNLRIPYLIIIGDKEKESKNITYRQTKTNEEGNVLVDDLIVKILEEINTKK